MFTYRTFFFRVMNLIRNVTKTLNRFCLSGVFEIRVTDIISVSVTGTIYFTDIMN